MLTCLNHARLIDDATQVADYPEQRLLEYKAEHEERVRMLTAVTGSTRTDVVVVRVPIDSGHEVPIADVFEAILPDFPLRETPQRIDLNDFGTLGSAADFQAVATRLATRVKSVLRARQEAAETSTLSVFAIAPVGLLMYLGSVLGDMVPVQAFQWQRRSEKWSWDPDWPDGQEETYVVTAPAHVPDGAHAVALFLEVSARVPQRSIAEVLPGEWPVYRLGAGKPSRDFLQRRNQVTVFGIQVRELLDRIVHENPEVESLHVFAAVPAPIAIELGRHLRFSIRSVQTYEFRKSDRTYWPCLQYTPTEVPV